MVGTQFKIFLILFCLNSFAVDYWPTEGWKTRTLEESGFDTDKFNELLEYVWEDEGNHRSDAFIVIKDGYLVYEGYANGYHDSKKHMFWSFTKSLSSTLAGIALQKGIIKLDDEASKYYPRLNRPKADKITIRHILNMSSGFSYYEENPYSIALSDSIFVYYSKKAYKDVAVNVANMDMKFSPDEQFNYGTHEPMLLMGIIKKAINNQEVYENFPWEHLLNPLGMKSVTIERDLSGTFLGGSGGWGTAKDYAKLGFLMLNDGVWDGKRILPEWWLKFATKTVAPAQLKRISEEGQQRLNVESYGAYWWLNKKLAMNKNRPYPSAPEDLYQAMGFRGQTMGVIPSKNLIVVRMGSDGRKPNKKMKRDKLYKLLMASLRSK